MAEPLGATEVAVRLDGRVRMDASAFTALPDPLDPAVSLPPNFILGRGIAVHEDVPVDIQSAEEGKRNLEAFKARFPRGCMHSLAATVTVAVAFRSFNESEDTPTVSRNINISIYVGQRIAEVVSEFKLWLEQANSEYGPTTPCLGLVSDDFWLVQTPPVSSCAPGTCRGCEAYDDIEHRLWAACREAGFLLHQGTGFVRPKYFVGERLDEANLVPRPDPETAKLPTPLESRGAAKVHPVVDFSDVTPTEHQRWRTVYTAHGKKRDKSLTGAIESAKQFINHERGPQTAASCLVRVKVKAGLDVDWEWAMIKPTSDEDELWKKMKEDLEPEDGAAKYLQFFADYPHQVQGLYDALKKKNQKPHNKLAYTTIFTRGDNGENAFHMAILHRSDKPGGHAIIEYLASTFGPQLVRAPYQSKAYETPTRTGSGLVGLFDGEAPLHMAVAFRDSLLVRFLVERGADVRARCHGSFFRTSEDPLQCYQGRAYYGEYPASFAVALGEPEILRYLADKGADIIGDRDSLGNTALHLAVLHSRPRIFDFLSDELFKQINVKVHFLRGHLKVLRWSCKDHKYKDDINDPHKEKVKTLRELGYKQLQGAQYEGKRYETDEVFIFKKLNIRTIKAALSSDLELAKFFENKLHYQNGDGHTPLTLAALTRRIDGFVHTLFRERELLWRYGALRCFALRLGQIDPDLDVTEAQAQRSGTTVDEVPKVAGGITWGARARDVRDRVLDLFMPVGRLRLSALEIMIGNGDSGKALDLLNTEVMVRVLEYKWASFARGWFYVSLGMYIVVLVLFSLLCVHYRYGLTAPNPAPVLKPAVQNELVCMATALVPGNGSLNCDLSAVKYQGSPYDAESTVLEVLTFVAVLSVGLVEAWDLLQWLVRRLNELSGIGRSHLLPPKLPPPFAIPGSPKATYESLDWAKTLVLRQRSAGRFLRFYRIIKGEVLSFNAVSALLWIFCGLQSWHFNQWLAGKGNSSYNPDLAGAAIVAWLYLLYFAPGFASIGPLLVVITRIFTRDLLRFIALYMPFLVGFSLSLFVLVRSQYVNSNTQTLLNNEFGSFGTSLVRLFRHSLGEAVFDQVGGNELNPSLTLAVVIGFTVSANVVLLNLLIALMSNTVNSISEDAVRIWRLQWARLIIEQDRKFGAAGPVLETSLLWWVHAPLIWAAGYVRCWFLARAGYESTPKPWKDIERRPRGISLNIYTENPSQLADRQKAAAQISEITALSGRKRRVEGTATHGLHRDTSYLQAAFFPYVARLEARKERAEKRVLRHNQDHGLTASQKDQIANDESYGSSSDEDNEDGVAIAHQAVSHPATPNLPESALIGKVLQNWRRKSPSVRRATSMAAPVKAVKERAANWRCRLCCTHKRACEGKQTCVSSADGGCGADCPLDLRAGTARPGSPPAAPAAELPGSAGSPGPTTATVVPLQPAIDVTDA